MLNQGPEKECGFPIYGKHLRFLDLFYPHSKYPETKGVYQAQVQWA